MSLSINLWALTCVSGAIVSHEMHVFLTLIDMCHTPNSHQRSSRRICAHVFGMPRCIHTARLLQEQHAPAGVAEAMEVRAFSHKHTCVVTYAGPNMIQIYTYACLYSYMHIIPVEQLAQPGLGGDGNPKPEPMVIVVIHT